MISITLEKKSSKFELLKLECSCGTILQAFQPDEGEYFGVEGEMIGAPTLSPFDPWWTERVDEEDRGWVVKEEERFIEGGLYAANLEDALRKQPVHDVFSTGGVLIKTGHKTDT